mgnify:CR=1 FL=1
MIYNNNNFNKESGNYVKNDNYKFTSNFYIQKIKDTTATENNANLIKNVPKINIVYCKVKNNKN